MDGAGDDADAASSGKAVGASEDAVDVDNDHSQDQNLEEGFKPLSGKQKQLFELRLKLVSFDCSIYIWIYSTIELSSGYLIVD